MLSDSRMAYGRVTRLLHWVMALLIVWQLLKFGDRIADGEHWVGRTLVPWHISIGILVISLAVLRAAWAWGQAAQRPLPDPRLARWVRLGHILLYAGMLLMPVTGIALMVGNGYGLEFFGRTLVAEGPEIAWAAKLGDLHSPLAWGVLVLIIGHVAVALNHHFIKRDDTLRRML